MPRETGRGHPIITEEKLRSFLRNRTPQLAGTTEIAEEFDVARQSAIDRLNTFEERGIVRRVEVGRSYGWWLDEDVEGKKQLAPEPVPGGYPGSPTGESVEGDGPPQIKTTDGGGVHQEQYLRDMSELWDVVFDQREELLDRLKNIELPFVLGGFMWIIGHAMNLHGISPGFLLGIDGKTMQLVAGFFFALTFVNALGAVLRSIYSQGPVPSGTPFPGDIGYEDDSDYQPTDHLHGRVYKGMSAPMFPTLDSLFMRVSLVGTFVLGFVFLAFARPPSSDWQGAVGVGAGLITFGVMWWHVQGNLTAYLPGGIVEPLRKSGFELFPPLKGKNWAVLVIVAAASVWGILYNPPNVLVAGSMSAIGGIAFTWALVWWLIRKSDIEELENSGGGDE